MGLSGLVRLAEKKLVLTWGDGSIGYNPLFLSMRKSSKAYDYLAGDRRDRFMLYAQAYYMTIVLMSMVSVIYHLIRQDEKSYAIIWYIVELTLLGNILFYIIWEAQSHYGLSLNILLLIMMFEGVDCMGDSLVRLMCGANKAASSGCISSGKLFRCCIPAAFLIFGFLTLGAGIFIWKGDSSEKRTFAARVAYSPNENILIGASESAEQSFVSGTAFDTVYINGIIVGDGAEKASCLIQLCTEKGDILTEKL